MAVREFDGADDEIVCSTGDLSALTGGGVTIVAIMRRDVDDAFHSVWSMNDSDDNYSGWGLLLTSTGNPYIAADGAGPNFEINPSDGWVLVGVGKEAGAQTPRFHRYVYGTDTWTHQDGDATQADGVAGGASGRVKVGTFGDGFDRLDGRIAVVGVWGSVLSDGQFEELTDHLSSWAAADPDALWAFNQDATTTDVVDLTGNGADQTSITGTTVVTDDDPPGFSFEFEPVREFDGTDDNLAVQAAGDLGGFNYGTVAFLLKPLSFADESGIFNLHDDLDNWQGGIRITTSGGVSWYSSGDHASGSGILSADEWYLVVARKPTGNTDVRFSIYEYATDGWTHSASSTPGAGDWGSTGTSGSITFRRLTGDDPPHIRIAARAAWPNSTPFPANASGDSQIEAAGFEVSLDNWADFSPDALWRFNQDSTATAVNDLTGGGADQTSITGTTVITNDPVPGFSYEISTSSDVDVTSSDAPVAVVAVNAAMINIGPSPTAATVSVAANNATVERAGNPDGVAATVGVAANNATVDAVGDAEEANAIAATVSVTANDSGVDVGTVGSDAHVSVAGQGAIITSQSQVTANRATVGVVANDATVVVQNEVITVNAQVATVGVTANDATPTGEANATATAATVSVTANSPSKSVTGIATVDVAAHGAQAAINAGEIAHATNASVAVSAFDATVTVSENVTTGAFEARISVTANNAATFIVEVPLPTYTFQTPHETRHHPKYARDPVLSKFTTYEQGLSVVKRNGTWTNVEYIYLEDRTWIEGIDYFVGGYTYFNVPESVALDLQADGYTVVQNP